MPMRAVEGKILVDSAVVKSYSGVRLINTQGNKTTGAPPRLTWYFYESLLLIPAVLFTV